MVLFCYYNDTITYVDMAKRAVNVVSNSCVTDLSNSCTFSYRLQQAFLTKWTKYPIQKYGVTTVDLTLTYIPNFNTSEYSLSTSHAWFIKHHCLGLKPELAIDIIA